MPIPTKINADYRCALCVIATRELRHAIDRNGGKYDGRLVPNLTTITDILTLPDEILLQQLKNFEARGILPMLDEIAQLVRTWGEKSE